MHLKSIVLLAAVIPAASSRPIGIPLSSSLTTRDTGNGVLGERFDDLAGALQVRDSNG